MPADDLTGAMLKARYRVTDLLGAGGMGQVYAGMDETLDRRVAIKVLLRKLADEERFRQRFLREAKAASKIQHPNVVQILDFGEAPGGSVFYAMEFLEGRDLAAVLRSDGSLPWARARNILLQIVKALGATHDRNIIHRDIKPANFFVLEARGHQDFIKLLDFGIAKQAADPDRNEKSLAESLTGAGEVVGTAKYMAPEQAYGSSGDPRVDVYAVGVVAYEMLTGTVPFHGSSVFEILKKHVDVPPRPPRQLNPSIPPEVEAIVLRALAKDQRARFGSMDEFESALASVPATASGGAPTATAGPPHQATPGFATRPMPAEAPSTSVMDSRAPSEPPGPPRRRHGEVASPGAAGLAQARATSEQVTAPTHRMPSPDAVGSSTLVAPTSSRPPSPVTHGQIDPALGHPQGRGSGPSPAFEPVGRAPVAASSGSSSAAGTASESSSSGSTSGAASTSPIAMPGGVGTSTGPASSVSVGAETDPHTNPVYDSSNRPSSTKPLMVVLGSAAVVALSFVAVVAMFGDSQSPEAEVSSKPAATVAKAPVQQPGPPAETPSSSQSEPPKTEGDVGVAKPTEPVAEPTPEPVPVEPTPKPEPNEAKPKPKPKRTSSGTKTRKPPTDAQVSSKLARKLAKSCGSHGSGTVTVDLIVSSTGSVVTRSAPGASPELRKCLLANVGGASFPEGGTRKVSVKVKL